MDQDRTFPKILERLLNAGGGGKYEVIDGGVGNYNTRQEIAAYRLELSKYRPDKVIIAWYVNDAEPTQKYSDDFFAGNSMAYAFVTSVARRVGSALGNAPSYAGYYSSLYSEESWDAYSGTLAALPSTFDTGSTVVALLPELHEIRPYPFAGEYSKVASAFRGLGYEVTDATASFTGSASDYWVARDDVHPNALGHEIIARHIYETFFSHGKK